MDHPSIPFALAMLLYMWGAYGCVRRSEWYDAWISLMYALANIGFVLRFLK